MIEMLFVLANNLNEKTGGSRSEGITAIAGDVSKGDDGDGPAPTDKGQTSDKSGTTDSSAGQT